jgi:hypothetical protein
MSIAQVVAGTLIVGTEPGGCDVKTPILAQVVVPSATALTLDGHGAIQASGAAYLGNPQHVTSSVTGAGEVRRG